MTLSAMATPKLLTRRAPPRLRRCGIPSPPGGMRWPSGIRHSAWNTGRRPEGAPASSHPCSWAQPRVGGPGPAGPHARWWLLDKPQGQPLQTDPRAKSHVLRTVGVEVEAEDEIGMPPHRLEQLAARHLSAGGVQLSRPPRGLGRRSGAFHALAPVGVGSAPPRAWLSGHPKPRRCTGSRR